MTSLAHARAPVCEMKQPTKIKINPVTKKLTYDITKPLSTIQNVKSGDGHNPYGFHQKTVTQGFMKGAIKMVPGVKIGGFEVGPSGDTCLWYEEIVVDIEIDPQIVIAKEVYEDSCLRRAVLEHEKKHVAVDRKLVNAFSKRVGHSLKNKLGERGFYVGFFPKHQKQAVMTDMQNAVQDIVMHEYKRLELDRKDAQNRVDSREEYDRVSKQCEASQRKLQANMGYN